MTTQTIKINSKEITYTIDKNENCLFPELFKESKNGKNMWWQIFTNKNTIYIEKTFENSDKTTKYKPVTVTGKNIGKKNETLPHEQALLEAHSQWIKKIEQGYKNGDDGKESEEGKKEKEFVLPMLANKYNEKLKIDKTEGIYVSEKLDGIRAICKINEDDKVEMWSRTGKLFPFFNEIKESVKIILNKYNKKNLILDGELYSHDISFATICSIVKKTKKSDPKENLIYYYIFDIIDSSLEYTIRLRMLEDIMDIVDKLNLKNIKIVTSNKIYNHNEIKEYHDEYVKKGYEGLILRKCNSKYEIGHRSSNLLKYKEFCDDEFIVVKVICSEGGTEDKCAIFVCKDNNSDKTFNVRPRGTLEKRREQYLNKEKYINKKLTVRWQPSNNESSTLPRFGVGICFRDYE